MRATLDAVIPMIQEAISGMETDKTYAGVFADEIIALKKAKAILRQVSNHFVEIEVSESYTLTEITKIIS